MRELYLKHKQKAYSSSGDEYLEDKKVEPGKVLQIKNLAATFTNMASTEAAKFYVLHNGKRFFVGEDLPSVTSGYSDWSGPIAIGEGDQVGVYFPDIASTEVGQLFIFGELWSLEAWRKVQ